MPAVRLVFLARDRPSVATVMTRVTWWHTQTTTGCTAAAAAAHTRRQAHDKPAWPPAGHTQRAPPCCVHAIQLQQAVDTRTFATFATSPSTTGLHPRSTAGVADG